MATAQDVFTTSVRDLSQSEKLRLATMILEELSETSAQILDYSDSWSDEDLRDLTAYALKQAESRTPE